ncbi:MAG: phosphoenolpyruvate--protein phosphotransferase, partial [Acidobacteria bacterium]
MEKAIPAAAEISIVRGTPVVPGVAYGPVVRPAPRPQIPTTFERIPDTARDAEAERFRAAAGAVAERLRSRAGRASGAAAEVLLANAQLAEDRGWLGAVAAKIRSGSGAIEAAVGATDQFADMFTKLGGLMAERVTDLLDIRDRVIAELAGHPE